MKARSDVYVAAFIAASLLIFSGVLVVLRSPWAWLSAYGAGMFTIAAIVALAARLPPNS